MFDDFQLSRFLGKPARLFRFELQGVVIGRFTTAPIDIVSGGFTWTSAQIDRSEIKETIEPAKDKLTVKFAYLRNPFAPVADLPSTQALGDFWNPYPPPGEVRVVCLATHIGDTDPPKVEWMGKVVAPEFTDAELTLACEPGPAIAKALNQGWLWQVSCPKTVYSTGPRGCGLDPDAFAVSTTLTAASGVTLTSADFATAVLSLAGGWLEWTRTDGFTDQRLIMTHVDDAITVQYGAPDFAIGLAVVARPSCEQTFAACAERFPTPEDPPTVHYGGAIYKPINDPLKDSMSWG